MTARIVLRYVKFLSKNPKLITKNANGMISGIPTIIPRLTLYGK